MAADTIMKKGVEDFLRHLATGGRLPFGYGNGNDNGHSNDNGTAQKVPLFAEERPISEFPKDVVGLATAWITVPQQMVTVTREAGPLAGLTYGPVKGSARLVDETTELALRGDSTEGSWKFLYAF